MSQLLAQTWLRQLLAPSPRPAELAFPCQVAGCSSMQLELLPHLLPLAPLLQLCALCPCHQQPVAAQAAGSSQAGCAASQQPAQPQAHQCAVSGQPVPASACMHDPALLQLGARGVLRLQGPVAGLAAGSLFSRPLAAQEPCRLQVERVVAAGELPAPLTWGPPLVLRAPSQAAQSGGAPEAPGAGAAAGTPPAQRLRLLCAALMEGQQVLLVSSCHDLTAGTQSALRLHYLLQPSTEGDALLGRALACREQLLPPPCGQGDDDGGAGLRGEVMLEAGQVEAVRQELAALGGASGSQQQGVLPFDALQLSCGLHERLAPLLKAAVGCGSLREAPAPTTVPSTAAGGVAAGAPRGHSAAAGGGQQPGAAAAATGAMPPPMMASHGGTAEAPMGGHISPAGAAAHQPVAASPSSMGGQAVGAQAVSGAAAPVARRRSGSSGGKQVAGARIGMGGLNLVGRRAL